MKGSRPPKAPTFPTAGANDGGALAATRAIPFRPQPGGAGNLADLDGDGRPSAPAAAASRKVRLLRRLPTFPAFPRDEAGQRQRRHPVRPP